MTRTNSLQRTHSKYTYATATATISTASNNNDDDVNDDDCQLFEFTYDDSISHRHTKHKSGRHGNVLLLYINV